MGSPPVPHPDYLITLVGPGSGAGAGVPGVAVRDALTGRVPGRMDVYSAIAGAGTNRLFFLAARRGREQIANRDPDISQIPPGGAFRLRLNDDGTVASLSAVPGIPEPGPAWPGPIDLAATADGSKLAFPRRQRLGPRHCRARWTFRPPRSTS